MNRRGVVASAAAVALVLAGCTPASSPTAPPVATIVGEALASFHRQDPTWTPCGSLECARVEVPLDHADPAGERLSLAVQRRPASARPRLGTLFVNPGGPAVSGRGLLAPLASTGLAGYDLVAWDTRGTGESSAVDCLPDAAIEDLLALDASPDTPGEEDALRAAERGLARACLETAGAGLLANLTSQDTARDLDILRTVLGDGQLNYAGWSYGTLPGAAYAALYPDRVGRLLLDSPVDVAGDGPPLLVGADRSRGRVAAWGVGMRGGLGDAGTEVLATVGRVLDDLDAAPLDVGGRPLGQTEATYGVLAHLGGGRAAWPALVDAVRAASAGDGRALLAAVDAQNGRLPSGGYDATLTSRLATVCADTPRPDATAAARRAGERAAAPFFSRYLRDDFGCGAWPAPAAARPDVGAVRTGPVLVVGGLGDAVTPHEYAEALASRLDNAVLLTWTGDGHGVFPSRSDCVDLTVVAYLTTGEAPADRGTCP